MKSPDLSPHRSERWRVAYESVVSNADYSVRLDRIADARNAIFDRAEVILTHPSADEGRALSHALRTLRLLEETAIREREAA